VPVATPTIWSVTAFLNFLSSLDWGQIVATVIAAAVPGAIAIYLARRERQRGERERALEREQLLSDNATMRRQSAIEKLQVALADMTSAAILDSVEDVSVAGLRWQVAGLPLMSAVDAADHDTIKRWIDRSAVLYKAFTTEAVSARSKDRSKAGATTVLIGLQLDLWSRGIVSAQQLLVDPPDFRDEFDPDNEVLASLGPARSVKVKSEVTK
jgi:hypothetical protein